jgi:predicted nucleic acid-binding protein
VPLLFWDASALVKRYAAEAGADTVDAQFTQVPALPMVVTILGYAETYSVLLRKFNRGTIDLLAFTTAKASLRTEVVHDPDFSLLSVDDAAIFAGISLMELYNVNAIDGAILALFLRYVQALPTGSPTSVLVAADQRLLAAAQAEGLATLNPESLAAPDVPAFLNSL